jgi:ABC-type dipeptide/oligopeptide/nickel transport system ATPase component
MSKALLQVRDLRTHFETRAGTIKAVDGISFTLERGEILGLVGESGSGKSVTGFSLIGLLDAPGRIAGGSVLFDRQELVGLPQSEMRKLRGKRIAMIFQDPAATLNPVLTIGSGAWWRRRWRRARPCGAQPYSGWHSGCSGTPERLSA